MEDFRRESLGAGHIDTAAYIDILSGLRSVGFGGVSFTGGEPMMNQDWDRLVKSSGEIGFDRIELTTNATLIDQYLNAKNKFPDELTTIKISIDTFDESKFAEIIGKGVNLNEIISAISRLRSSNPDLTINLNKVLLQKNIDELHDFVESARELGVNGISFLDLILRDAKDLSKRRFFEEQFISARDIGNEIMLNYPTAKIIDGRRGPRYILDDGFTLEVKDSYGDTLRDDKCDSCSEYCQEGLFTAFVATDGYVGGCLSNTRGNWFDTKNKTAQDVGRGILTIYRRLAHTTPDRHFDEFLTKNEVGSPSRLRHSTDIAGYGGSSPSPTTNSEFKTL